MAAPYTAVVYFHGMGNQRRYEEVSRLIDALDRYSPHQGMDNLDAIGTLSNIKTRTEAGRGNQKEDVTFVRTIHKYRPDESATSPEDNASPIKRQTVRFYEAYWAPLTAEGVPARQVLTWLAAQVLTPVATIRSPWRYRARLRRAALQRYWHRVRDAQSSPYPDGDLLKMLRAYDAFERPDARAGYLEGTFREFLDFLEKTNTKRPKTTERLIRLARQWRRYYLQIEFTNLLVLISLALLLVIGLLGLLAFAAGLLQLLNVAWVQQLFGDLLPDPTAGHMGSLIILLAGLTGLTRFLRTYLGDVQFWTTYEETNVKYDKRKRILALATSLLRHVLEDEACRRVVVVAHSLGTPIAQDALLAIGRYNRTRNLEAAAQGPIPIAKLDHLITLGSPIDKVHYFFESMQGAYHRHIRVLDEVRGDVGTVPFAHNRKPHIHWINIWDQGDPVSGALHTPSNKKWVNLRVDNLHVTNWFFPSPGASHSGYFNHQKVMALLHAVIFHQAHSFSTVPRGSKNEPLYDTAMVGPGRFSKVTRAYRGVLLLIPWQVLIVGLMYLLDYDAWGWYAGTGVLGASVLAVMVGLSINAARGHAAPLP